MSKQHEVSHPGMLAISFPVGAVEIGKEAQRTSEKRVWLKGSTAASLIVNRTKLVVLLQGRPLIQYDLISSTMQYKLLSAQQTGSCGLFVGVEVQYESFDCVHGRNETVWNGS